MTHFPADYAEREDLRCEWCASDVLGPTGTSKRRYRVIHEAACPALARYRSRLPGYTALPSGQVVRAGDPVPPGTVRLVANSPTQPCGAVVTHRGPYARRAAA